MKSRTLIPVIVLLCCVMFAAILPPLLLKRGPTESAGDFDGSPWPRSTPEEQGLDSELLVQMLERIRDEDLKVRSTLIVRSNHLVLEAYVHPYDRETLHDVKSVSKSVISALVGTALRDGILRSIEQPIYEFFPHLTTFADDSLKRDITIEHLLTMTSGLDIDENGPAMRDITAQANWIESTFSRSLLRTPGESFQYCTLLTLAMTHILTDASGTDMTSLADTLLFGPLGIEKMHWGKDPEGYYFGGDRMWLRPMDMAKIGNLFLNAGQWRNVSIVPQSWVTASTTNQISDFDLDGYGGYGYWWWLPGDGTYRARGAFGQIITVYPETEMVVVFTGASNDDWERLTEEYILPAVARSPLLPPDPKLDDRLQSLVQELGSPPSVTAGPLPSLAREISGKRFTLTDNDLEFTDVTFWFEQADEGRVVLGHPDGALDMRVGLDGLYRLTTNLDWGMRDDGNTIGLRCEWIDGNKLALDFHEVGEPFYFDIELEFDENRLQGTFNWQPVGWSVAIQGVRD